MCKYQARPVCPHGCGASLYMITKLPHIHTHPPHIHAHLPLVPPQAWRWYGLWAYLGGTSPTQPLRVPSHTGPIHSAGPTQDLDARLALDVWPPVVRLSCSNSSTPVNQSGQSVNHSGQSVNQSGQSVNSPVVLRVTGAWQPGEVVEVKASAAGSDLLLALTWNTTSGTAKPTATAPPSTLTSYHPAIMLHISLQSGACLSGGGGGENAVQELTVTAHSAMDGSMTLVARVAVVQG